MSCTSALSGCILVIINILFFIIGLGFAAAGAIIKWAPFLYTNHLKELLIKAAGLGANKTEEIGKVLDNIFAYVNNYGIVIFVIGLVFALIALLAMCGVCCKSKCIIGTYAVIVGIIACAVIAFTIVLFVKPELIKDLGERTIRTFVVNEYKGQSGANFSFTGVSGVLDIIQLTYNCCGVTNYTDFEQAGKWNNSITIAVNGASTTLSLKVPLSCCNVKPGQINSTILQSCMADPNEQNSHIGTPCYKKLWTEIHKYWKYVQYGFLGVSIFMVLMLIIAFCATRFNDDKIDPI